MVQRGLSAQGLGAGEFFSAMVTDDGGAGTDCRSLSPGLRGWAQAEPSKTSASPRFRSLGRTCTATPFPCSRRRRLLGDGRSPILPKYCLPPTEIFLLA